MKSAFYCRPDISSVEVLNKTTVDRRSHGQREHRVELQENLSNQKILLKAIGNAPSYWANCYRYEEFIIIHSCNNVNSFIHSYVSAKNTL